MLPQTAARRSACHVQAAALLLAPALFALSTFFWRDVDGRTEYGATGGALVALGSVFWIPAFQALFGLVEERMPRFAAWGWLVAVYGTFGGMAFGIEGLFAEAFGLPHDTRQTGWRQFPTPFNVTFFWPGPLFPLSLIGLGVVLFSTRATPRWIAVLLALAGLAFPASRIPRLALVAHAADLLMLVPLAYVAIILVRRQTSSLV